MQCLAGKRKRRMLTLHPASGWQPPCYQAARCAKSSPDRVERAKGFARLTSADREAFLSLFRSGRFSQVAAIAYATTLLKDIT
jgi:hypothetical protein